MIVCNCRCLSDRDVASAMAAQPCCRSASKLYHGMCGETFSCGRCKDDIQTMIDDNAASAGIAAIAA